MNLDSIYSTHKCVIIFYTAGPHAGPSETYIGHLPAKWCHCNHAICVLWFICNSWVNHLFIVHTTVQEQCSIPASTESNCAFSSTSASCETESLVVSGTSTDTKVIRYPATLPVYPQVVQEALKSGIKEGALLIYGEVIIIFYYYSLLHEMVTYNT